MYTIRFLCAGLLSIDMALLKSFNQWMKCLIPKRHFVTDPKAPHWSQIPSVAIAQVNCLLQETRSVETVQRKQRGTYERYSQRVCRDLAVYSCNHWVASPARVFSQKLQWSVNKSMYVCRHSIDKCTVSSYIQQNRLLPWLWDFPKKTFCVEKITWMIKFRRYLHLQKFTPQNFNPENIFCTKIHESTVTNTKC